MSKMSQENLLEMGELYRELDDMVPERDSGQKPKPKPRSRQRSSTMSTSTPNKLAAVSGVSNPSFLADENEIDSRNSSWGWSGRRKGGDTFIDPSSSEDSLVSPSRKATRTPISIVSDVQVHHSFDDPSGDSVNTTDVDEERTSLRFENETISKRQPPKPKPRTKSGLSSSENDAENIEPKPRQRTKTPETLPREIAVVSPKEDFLAVTIPEKEIGTIKSADDQIVTNSKSDGIFGKMKNRARSFLSAKSTSSLVVESTPGIEPEPIEIKSPKTKLAAAAHAPEEFELKPVVQKRKSARRRDAETSRDQIALDKDESAILNPKISTTPLPSSKRDKRRRESEACITKLLGVTIHNSDMLPSDPNILHPLVKVTVMDQNGLYLTRNDFENEEPTHKKSPKPKPKNKKDTEAENLDEDKLIASRAKEKLSVNLKKSSVLPILTQTFEINRQVPSFAPTWNELLVFEEPFQRFVGEDSSIIFFFEIMDFLPMSNAVIRRGWGDYHGGEPGWYKIAWAFLKPVGINGIRNVNRKLRLQLYKPEALTTTEKQHGPEVYCWWKLGKRGKINATLYVTLKGITPPSGAAASLRTLLTMRKDHLTQAILDSQLASTKKSRKKRAKDLERKQGALDLRRPQWTRHEGQSCKVPNKLIATLPSSQVASLNLTVCGNVHSVKFSPCGLKLAAGLDTDELHIVLIFEIPSGTLLKNLRGHHGLIYDLDWKSNVTDQNGDHALAPTSFLASASADSTVLVWKIGEEANCQLIQTFSHPSFVYCVKFHPTKPNLIVTGCFDYIIRIWDFREIVASSESSPAHSGTSPLILLDRHFSFVNCIAIPPSGEFLFSGDGSGSLYKWKISSRNKRKWQLEQNIKLSETGKHAINDVVVHPNGNRLLVQIRDSCLKIVDIESFLTLQSFTGLVNEKLQIRSCMSPCGNLVLSGSEDASLCIWDADTGRIMEFITPENHPNCIVTSVDYHPYDHYVVIGLSSLISEPNPVMLYAYVSPDLEQRSKTPSLPLSTVIRLKSNLRRQRGTIDSEDQLALNRTVTFAPSRGDSTEKFIKIIKKLDTALKIRKVIEGQGQQNLVQELETVTAEEEIQSKENELMISEKEGSGVRTVKPRSASIPEQKVIQIFPKEDEDWSVSSISQSPEPRVQKPERNSRPSSAAVTASERSAIVVTARSEQVATPESDSTTASSSKREKRRRQIQEKTSGIGNSPKK